MYRPAAFATDDAESLELIAACPLAQLIVVADDSPMATPVPLMVRDDSLVGHLARPNPVWHHPGPALAIFTGPDAYVSPRWYEGKSIDGKVVPTWNYVTVQVAGQLVAHDDPEWTLQLVTDLTEHFEAAFDAPWAVSDAPADYLRTMVRGIVGIELTDLQIVGKVKLSQNRSIEDQQRVVAGLAVRSAGEQAIARAMKHSAQSSSERPV
ncbi:MAG: transcriptional regulator [Ilumatobacteraceae bacterium]|nr:transcriptional regulator [Ilumatobacteraceae bacterium]